MMKEEVGNDYDNYSEKEIKPKGKKAQKKRNDSDEGYQSNSSEIRMGYNAKP